MKLDVRFIGVGAVKSGSSWMASLLGQHPEVAMSSRKEVSYFNRFNLNGTPNYSSSFDFSYYKKFWSNNNKIKGEVSPQYLFDMHAPLSIKKMFPNTHILIMLRNPSEVVYSHFLYEKLFNRSIKPNLSLEKAIQANSYLLETASFSDQVERYLSVFGENKVHIYLMEEALKDPSIFSKKLYSDIDLVDVDFKPSYNSVNQSKKVRSNLIFSLLTIPSLIKKIIEGSRGNCFVDKIKQTRFYINLVNARDRILDKNISLVKKPKMSLEESKLLESYFKKDIENLETLLDRDLSEWKASD